MPERLKALLHLQEIDNAIQRTVDLSRSLPIRARAAERELMRSREALEALRHERLALQKEADQRELQLRSGEATVGKLQAQRLTVKTNREYQALTNQIGGTQTENARLEDQVLALYAKIEEAQRAYEEQAGAVERLTAQLNVVLAQNREEAQRLEEQLAGLKAQREAARREVPDDFMRLYAQLRGRLSGPPVAAVRDEVCTGCNMSVSPQTVSALRLGRDLVQCTSCTRILYLDGDGS